MRNMWFASSSVRSELPPPGESESGLVQSCEICVRSGAGQRKTDAARPAYIARSRSCLGIKGPAGAPASPGWAIAELLGPHLSNFVGLYITDTQVLIPYRKRWRTVLRRSPVCRRFG